MPRLPPPVACTGSPCWVPPANTSWQIQLQGKIKTTFNVRLYDVDLFDTPQATINALHAAGRKVACYFSAGSYENWRSDAARFPAAVKGGGNGWPGEQWLDVRRLDLLMPIMEARLDLCKAKGFDSVDPDNMDGYTNTTGFPLTAADQLAYNASIANAAHARGPHRRAEERPQPDRAARPLLRLGAQRAVLPVPGVRAAQPVPATRARRS